MQIRTNTSNYFFCVFLFLIYPFSIFSQEKIERERSISVSEVPEEALEWFEDAFEEVENANWYLEITSGIKSFEAKFKYKEQRYSVEFSEDGEILDIEVLFKQKELPPSVNQTLVNYFKKNYRKYKIRKIQRQWIGEPDELEDAIDEDEIEEVETRYEIEFYGKSGEGKNLWEALFDAEGQLIKKRKVALRPTDNLNY